MEKTLRVCIHQLEEAMLFWFGMDCTSPGVENTRMDHTTFKNKKPTPAEAARVRHLLTTTQYTLASMKFRQVSGIDAHEAQMSEFCRITLILYSMTILNERAPSTSVGQQICGKFRRALTDLACGTNGVSDASDLSSWMLPLPVDFVLWAIFLAASVLMATESDIKNWLLESFAKLLSSDRGEVHDWSDLRSRLDRYFWVPSIHNSNFQWLWDEVEERRRK
jgi:hypothetical protein